MLLQHPLTVGFGGAHVVCLLATPPTLGYSELDGALALGCSCRESSMARFRSSISRWEELWGAELGPPLATEEGNCSP